MSVAATCPLIIPLLINKLFLRLEDNFAQNKQTIRKSNSKCIIVYQKNDWSELVKFLVSDSKFTEHNLHRKIAIFI